VFQADVLGVLTFSIRFSFRFKYEWINCQLKYLFVCLCQTLEFDLKGQQLSENDELHIDVKDKEMVGKDRYLTG
jgi:hypothetical protein